MTNQITSDNGIIRLYDGTIVYIESVQYSHDGITNWENPPFNPNSHRSTLDGVSTLGGHKYRRVRLAGTTTYQQPEYIMAEDGVPVELGINGEYIAWRYEGSTDWTNLILLDQLKGNPGEQGVPGTGLAFDRACAFDQKPILALDRSYTILSLGNHIIDASDVSNGKYYSNVGGNGSFVLCDSSTIGFTAIYWNGIDANGTGAYTTVGNNIVLGASGGTNTAGKLYVHWNGLWTLLEDLSVSDHKVAFSSAGNATIGYLNQFATSGTVTGTGTIGYSSEKLEINDGSITAEKFNSGTFDITLTNTGTEVGVEPSELIGDGLQIDMNNNIATKVSDIAGDGLEVLGEDLVVKTENLISGSASHGLETVATDDSSSLTPTPISRHLKVKTGNGITLGTSGVTAVGDSANGITVTASGIGLTTAGVQGRHLNGDTVDNTTIGITGTQLYVKDGGIGADQIADSSITPDKLEFGTAAIGDLLYFNGTSWTKLNRGAEGEVLKTISGDLSWETDEENTYTAGTGINITGGNVIVNTAVDRTVTLTSTTLTVTSSYPDFTVEYPTQVGNMKIVSGTDAGIYIQLGSTGFGARLEADDNGNLSLSTTKKTVFV